ncbi:MAG: hypothetical protein EA377_01635 [Phycisphaerales bacterium]|nr:MAG: hypothetical protein EA377_01635 [Phycisphaerales bacterium]
MFALIVLGCLTALIAPTGTAAIDHGVAAEVAQDISDLGSEVIVAQVEGMLSGSYYPNPQHSQLAGKQFIPMSGPSDPSGHATVVTTKWLGSSSGIASGVNKIYCWSSNDWINDGLLRSSSPSTVPPLPLPDEIKVFNHSWVGSGGSSAPFVIRRTDYLINRDDVLVIAGVNNSPPQRVLMSHMYNGISVGRAGGGHASEPTGLFADGPGRMKPEIVDTDSATSWTTARVSGAATALVHVARTTPQLKNEPLAERSEVIKAVLLAGASQPEYWSNLTLGSTLPLGVTEQPLDPIYGAGVANLEHSCSILAAGRLPGTSGIDAPFAESFGWDLASIPTNQSVAWKFEALAPVDEIVIVATWHRWINPANMDDWAIAEVHLRIERLEDKTAFPLTGLEGSSFYDVGNVVSQSSVDNVQMLRIEGLLPGRYKVSLERVDDHPNDWDVSIAWRWSDVLGNGQTPSGEREHNNNSFSIFAFLQLLNSWGVCPSDKDCPYDLNGDGQVGILDLLALLQKY